MYQATNICKAAKHICPPNLTFNLEDTEIYSSACLNGELKFSSSFFECAFNEEMRTNYEKVCKRFGLKAFLNYNNQLFCNDKPFWIPEPKKIDNNIQCPTNAVKKDGKCLLSINLVSKFLHSKILESCGSLHSKIFKLEKIRV